MMYFLIAVLMALQRSIGLSLAIHWDDQQRRRLGCRSPLRFPRELRTTDCTTFANKVKNDPTPETMARIGRRIACALFANNAYDLSFRFQLNYHPGGVNRMIRRTMHRRCSKQGGCAYD